MIPNRSPAPQWETLQDQGTTDSSEVEDWRTEVPPPPRMAPNPKPLKRKDTGGAEVSVKRARVEQTTGSAAGPSRLGVASHAKAKRNPHPRPPPNRDVEVIEISSGDERPQKKPLNMNNGFKKRLPKAISAPVKKNSEVIEILDSDEEEERRRQQAKAKVLAPAASTTSITAPIPAKGKGRADAPDSDSDASMAYTPVGPVSRPSSRIEMLASAPPVSASKVEPATPQRRPSAANSKPTMPAPVIAKTSSDPPPTSSFFSRLASAIPASTSTTHSAPSTAPRPTSASAAVDTNDASTHSSPRYTPVSKKSGNARVPAPGPSTISTSASVLQLEQQKKKRRRKQVAVKSAAFSRPPGPALARVTAPTVAGSKSIKGRTVILSESDADESDTNSASSSDSEDSSSPPGNVVRSPSPARPRSGQGQQAEMELEPDTRGLSDALGLGSARHTDSDSHSRSSSRNKLPVTDKGKGKARAEVESMKAGVSVKPKIPLPTRTGTHSRTSSWASAASSSRATGATTNQAMPWAPASNSSLAPPSSMMSQQSTAQASSAFSYPAMPRPSTASSSSATSRPPASSSKTHKPPTATTSHRHNYSDEVLPEDSEAPSSDAGYENLARGSQLIVSRLEQLKREKARPSTSASVSGPPTPASQEHPSASASPPPGSATPPPQASAPSTPAERSPVAPSSASVPRRFLGDGRPQSAPSLGAADGGPAKAAAGSSGNAVAGPSGLGGRKVSLPTRHQRPVSISSIMQHTKTTSTSSKAPSTAAGPNASDQALAPTTPNEHIPMLPIGLNLKPIEVNSTMPAAGTTGPPPASVPAPARGRATALPMGLNLKSPGTKPIWPPPPPSQRSSMGPPSEDVQMLSDYEQEAQVMRNNAIADEASESEGGMVFHQGEASRSASREVQNDQQPIDTEEDLWEIEEVQQEVAVMSQTLAAASLSGPASPDDDEDEEIPEDRGEGPSRRPTRSSSASSDIQEILPVTPPSDENVNALVETASNGYPDSAENLVVSVARPRGKTYGGFPVLNWKDYRKDLRNFTPECLYAADIPTALHDHVNRLSHYTRLLPGMRAVYQAMIQENTAADEPDAPPVLIQNTVDEEPTPAWEFYYTNKIYHGKDVPPPDIKNLVSCGCRGPCNPKSNSCACLKRQREVYGNTLKMNFAYDKQGNLLHPGYPIFECNDLCGCGDECINRVVQHGRKVGVAIRKTPNKGWGIFATQRIAKGQFIGIYSGELLTDQEAHERGVKYNKWGKTYLFDLDFHHVKDPDDKNWSNKYTVDAYHCGNFTRFLNHSCDPNSRLYPCYINEGNIEKPLLAIFSRRVIEAEEEICFNYQGNYPGDDDEDAAEDGENRQLTAQEAQERDLIYEKCVCGAVKCTGVMFK